MAAGLAPSPWPPVPHPSPVSQVHPLSTALTQVWGALSGAWCKPKGSYLGF